MISNLLLEYISMEARYYQCDMSSRTDDHENAYTWGLLLQGKSKHDIAFITAIAKVGDNLNSKAIFHTSPRGQKLN